ncbi:unnamed protein product [Caenorhabditis brenneri]
MSSISPKINRALNKLKICESLQSNATYLRVCIQYEVLEGLPCWDSYKRFCRKFGDDAMTFLEFEFWFMRFYNGETDVEYDQSKEPKKRKLLDLPTKLMAKISEDYLKPFDLVMLAQVCKDLHSFCDTRKPDPLGRIRLESIRLELSRSDNKVSYKNLDIQYSQLGNGYEMRSGAKNVNNITVDYGYFLNGIRDVLMALFNFKNANIYDLHVIVDSAKIEEWKKLIGKLSDALFNSKINLKVVHFRADDPIHFFPFLDLLKPGYLEEIEIYNSQLSQHIDFPFQRLAETEQWKQAKRGLMRNPPSNPEHFQYFYHLEEFLIIVPNLTMDFLMELSNIFIESPNFKTCFVKGELKFTTEEFAAKIGGWSVGDEYAFLWINGDGSVLEYSGEFGGKGRSLRINKKEDLFD